MIYVNNKHQHHFLCGCGCCAACQLVCFGVGLAVAAGGNAEWGVVVRIHCRAAPVRNANPPLILQKCPALV